MASVPDHQPTVTPTNRRSWLQLVRRAVMLYVVVPYLAVTMVFVVLQRKLMYRPTVADDLRADAVALDLRSVRDVRIQTPDGDVLRGWLLKAAERNGEQTAPLVVYFPGNSLNRYERVDDLREIAAGGYDVLIFDYRGFGDSSGSPTEQKLTSDAQLIWSYAREELGYEERRIVVFGESLGGAVALSLWSAKVANPPQPAAVILNATFVSMPRTVAWHYPLFPFQYLLLDRWPSDVRIPRVSVPMIVFHGTADEMIPVAHGQELAQLSRNARFIEIPEAPHNSIPQHRLRTELHRLRGAMVESGE